MIGSDTTFRDEWLEAAARAIFVSAYASYVEEGFSTDNSLTDDERAARTALPRAKNGQDWMFCAPETPIAAYALAGEFWARIEIASGTSMYILAIRAAQADSPCKACNAKDDDCEECDGRGYLEGVDVDEFGHYLAMQVMGSGVSWFDDHENFVISLPYIEVHDGTFAEETYKP